MTDTVQHSEDDEGKPTRGKGRGSRFCVLGRDVQKTLWTAPTQNRMNFVSSFLVLLAGTGADQRLTKWSAKACEEHVGVGKPRARAAIEELKTAGLIELTDASTRLAPQYRLPDVSKDEDPIFLPVQLVTGFVGEASILRRVRETGDPMILRLLIDLYGSIQMDVTYGVPINVLRQGRSGEEHPARKLSEVGVHHIWTMSLEQGLVAWQVIAAPHIGKGNNWQPFWDRVHLLRRIRAVVFEPWVFDGAEDDAEPMFPVDFGVNYTNQATDEVAELSRTCMQAVEALTVDRDWVLNGAGDFTVVLPPHHRPPALRGVAKLAVEADTPGCRRSFALRMRRVEEWRTRYRRVLDDASALRFDRPIGAPE